MLNSLLQKIPHNYTIPLADPIKQRIFPILLVHLDNFTITSLKYFEVLNCPMLQTRSLIILPAKIGKRR
jgi:hypothetical protein